MKRCIAVVFGFFIFSSANASDGLVEDEGVQWVRGHCQACHSLALVTQHRMTRDEWLEAIRWMQETQNLWDLGPAEPVVLDYLAKHYAPVPSGRRAPLPKNLLP